jgi:hypothetical protein
MTNNAMRAAIFAVVAAGIGAIAASASAETPKCVHDWKSSHSTISGAKSAGSYTCKAPEGLSAKDAKDTHAECSEGFTPQGSPVKVGPPLGGENMVGPPVYKKDGRYIYVCIVPPPAPK